MSSSSFSSDNSSSKASDTERRYIMTSQVGKSNFDYVSENHDSLVDAKPELILNLITNDPLTHRWVSDGIDKDDGIDIDDESLEVPFDLQIDPPSLFPVVEYVDPVDLESAPPPAKKAKLDEVR